MAYKIYYITYTNTYIDMYFSSISGKVYMRMSKFERGGGDGSIVVWWTCPKG